jgi:hypothetical protein
MEKKKKKMDNRRFPEFSAQAASKNSVTRNVGQSGKNVTISPKICRSFRGENLLLG